MRPSVSGDARRCNALSPPGGRRRLGPRPWTSPSRCARRASAAGTSASSSRAMRGSSPAFLALIMTLIAIEVIAFRESLGGFLTLLAIGGAGAALCLYAWLRFNRQLFLAEHIASQATCTSCRTVRQARVRLRVVRRARAVGQRDAGALPLVRARMGDRMTGGEFGRRALQGFAFGLGFAFAAALGWYAMREISGLSLELGGSLSAKAPMRTAVPVVALPAAGEVRVASHRVERRHGDTIVLGTLRNDGDAPVPSVRVEAAHYDAGRPPGRPVRLVHRAEARPGRGQAVQDRVRRHAGPPVAGERVGEAPRRRGLVRRSPSRRLTARREGGRRTRRRRRPGSGRRPRGTGARPRR